MKIALLGFAALMASVSSAAADKYESAIQSYLQSNIVEWVKDPVLVAAIIKQNAETSAYDQARIDYLDAKWRSGRFAENEPLIVDVLSNEAAEFLREQVANSNGAITEAFVMGFVGPKCSRLCGDLRLLAGRRS